MGKRTLRGVAGLLIVAVLLLAACGGGGTEEPSVTETDETAVVVEENEETAAPADDGGEAVAEEEATLAPEDQLPDTLVLHPDAYDMVFNPAADTYVYMVPAMVGEVMDYMLAESKAKGWEELGQPSLMSHLATLTLQMGKDRLTISMQDNEITGATRVQMLLMQQ